MATGGDRTVECSSCAATVTAEDAALLTAENSKGVWRYLCPDCLADLHVPKGYTLTRDLSFLRGGGAPAEASDGSASPAEAPDGSASPAEAPDGSSPAPDGSADRPRVVADFRGRVVTGEHPQERLRSGRVLMNRRQLVLATDERKTAIPLASVSDVVTTTESTDEEGDVIVAVTYRSGSGQDVAFVSAGRDTLRKFTAVLFRALLGGTAVEVRHPVPGGDGSTEPPVRSGVLRAKDRAIGATGLEEPVSIPLDRVVQVERRDREWPGGRRSVLAVDHRADGRTTTTEFAVAPGRKQRLLGRFAGLEQGT